jgi:hypothetical protein
MVHNQKKEETKMSVNYHATMRKSDAHDIIRVSVTYGKLRFKAFVPRKNLSPMVSVWQEGYEGEELRAFTQNAILQNLTEQRHDVSNAMAAALLSLATTTAKLMGISIGIAVGNNNCRSVHYDILDIDRNGRTGHWFRLSVGNLDGDEPLPEID